MIYLNDRKYSRPVGLVMRSLAMAGKAVSRMAILIIAALSSATVAHAAYVRIGTGAPVLPVITLPANINVSNNPTVGTVLQNVNTLQGLYASTNACPINESVVVNGTVVPGYTNIFLTNLPGVGVRFSVTKGWGGSFITVPYAETFSASSSNSGYYIKVELVVVGPVAGGTLSTIPSISISFSGTCFDAITQVQPVQVGSTVTASTCSVTTNTLSVSLPPTKGSNLPSVGSTFGDTNFSIGLNCAVAANAYLALSDSANPGNTSTVLSPAPGSTATGVGVQVSSGATILAFGPDSAANGQAQTWSAGKMKAGANTIPLTARYVRTGTVRGGALKGLATFTMSYQ